MGSKARDRKSVSPTHPPPTPHPPNSFTAWLGNNSSSTKQRRLLADLGARLAAAGGPFGARGSLRCDTVPTLRTVAVAPFKPRPGAPPAGTEAAAEAAATLRGVGLGKDDFDFLGDVTKFKTDATWGLDPYAAAPAAVKAAFTRSLNKDAPPPRWNKDDGGFVRVKGGKKSAAAKKAARARSATPGATDEDDGVVVLSDDGDSDADLPPDVAAERRAARLAARGVEFKPRGSPAGKGKGKGKAKAATAGGKGKAKK